MIIQEFCGQAEGFRTIIVRDDKTYIVNVIFYGIYIYSSLKISSKHPLQGRIKRAISLGRGDTAKCAKKINALIMKAFPLGDDLSSILLDVYERGMFRGQDELRNQFRQLMIRG